MTRMEMQTAFFSYVALFDRELRINRWIEENTDAAISILEGGWNVRADWRGDMIHLIMEVNPDHFDRLRDALSPRLIDQPRIELTVYLRVNDSWLQVDDVALGYVLLDPPKTQHFIDSVSTPLANAIEKHIAELEAAQEALRSLSLSGSHST